MGRGWLTSGNPALGPTAGPMTMITGATVTAGGQSHPQVHNNT